MNKTDTFNVVILIGSHPRHFYIAKKLYEVGLLKALVVEEREIFVPEPPTGLPDIDRKNFIRHFHDRNEAERRFFGEEKLKELPSDLPVLKVSLAELNSDKVKEWVLSHQPDHVLTYGVHKISDELLSSFPKYSWNIHGGLSPWYRGNITLFWPFYMLRPNWAGMTIHYLTAQLDGGAIVHHSVPELHRGDGVHDVACRAVVQVADDIVQILQQRAEGREFPGTTQKSSGKLFIGTDWHPQHLRVVYNLYNNDIVDRYLDEEIISPPPPLVTVL
ncbi:formyltransferase family protein [Aneurinibacillus migulanus]|uniref:Formyl transferase n=1 Tax=Aneurinibacillus migulanus TaxID=47500 RepID=A0A0M0GYV4_ANEMI|nr:formyltransferase family protein [Aneurinibacillus migulanus]KON94626.1 methionyl-tRNA formyltransferase [Aneurinibacillus migulanus]MED0892676.1 formyltransferase family protein [Aneurinibacillus migulanus]MED1614317.1 formyltransferase family protein [Aneurinibacillus migulanus]MED4730257.1 formyltransferase family protein [Aneurinibacillus migulanus]SDI48408.1 Formyl transferase [Aneurinibacillus migulanus]